MNYAKAHCAEQIGDQVAETSALLVELLMAFHCGEVAYCYWKSSKRVHLALNGATDLDLLVARRSRERALRILFALGFKFVQSARWRNHPAVMSFLGYDEPSGKILHVHIHFWIVLGNALVKNHRLPDEDSFICRSAQHQSLPIRMLHPTDEALLLMIRGSFELHRYDPITIRRWRSMNEKFDLDWATLRPRIDAAEFADRSRQLFTPDLARRISAQLASPHPWRELRRLRGTMERELKAYATCGAAMAFVQTCGCAILWTCGEINRRYLYIPRLPRRHPLGGGIVIAVAGVDGSGKSTLVANLRSWLEPEIDVMTIYFGTGQGRPSFILLPFKITALLISPFIKTKPRGASHGSLSDRPASLLYDLMFIVWATAVAIEKRGKLFLSRRAVARGFVVLTDRYPQSEIKNFNDGPMLHRSNYAPGWLRRFEAGVYDLAHRAAPDLLIKLHVKPETVARREPDMHPKVIRQRVDSFSELTFAADRIVSIDAERPLQDVIKKAKREVWASF